MRRKFRWTRVTRLASAVVAVMASSVSCGSRPARVSPHATTSTSHTTAKPPDRHVSSATAPPTTRVAPAAPAPATTTVNLTLVDPSRPTVSHGTTIATTRTLPTIVWLPADSSGHVQGRDLPWVVFIHGFVAEPARYAGMLQSWAKAGYAVAAPTLPLTSSSSGANTDEADMVNEPADVSFLISALLDRSESTTGPLAGLLDPRRIGVAGHSDGADVAFAAGYSVTFGDPRVRAVIDLSGQFPAGMGPYPGGEPPMLMIHSDQDTFVSHEDSATLYGALSMERWWVELHGVGHEPPFTESSAWSAVVDTVTVDFLDRVIGGHAVSAATIAAAADQQPTATLEASAPAGH